MGLRELLGLRPRREASLNKEADAFRIKFQKSLAEINDALSYTAANVSPKVQLQQVEKRDKLIVAYQIALKNLISGSAREGQPAADKVLTVAQKLAADISQQKNVTQQAADEWEDAQPLFESAIAMTDQMEDVDLEKSTTMRAILTKIQQHAKQKNHKLAAAATEQLASGLGIRRRDKSARKKRNQPGRHARENGDSRTANAIPRSAKAQAGTPVAAKGKYKDNFGLTELKVDGENLLVGNGLSIIGGKKHNQDSQDNHINSQHSKNRDGVMSVDGDPKNGSIPYSLSFSSSSDGMSLNFSLSVGPSETEFSSISMPLEARLDLFSHFRSETSSELSRYDQTPIDEEYVGGEGTYAIALAPGNPQWGEMIGPKYTIRISITKASPRMFLYFVNAPGLSTGVRDVEFSFNTVKAKTIATASGSIQVFRTDPQFLEPGPEKQPTQPPTKPPAKMLTFQAEKGLAHKIGRPDADGWSVNVLDPPKDFLAFGPYTRDVPAGQRTATYRLMLDNVTADKQRILTIDVYDADSKSILAQRDLLRNHFAKPFTYHDFDLPFSAVAGHRLEFRTFWHGFSYVRQDKVTVQ